MVFGCQIVLAKKIKINLKVKEVSTSVDNKGTMQASWTYEGQMPGPLLRVTEGDTVTIVLTNDAANKNSHSIDLHAAQVDVLSEFSDVTPGETKTFSFVAKYPGALSYPFGAYPMYHHNPRGLFVMILVDPNQHTDIPN